MTKHFSQKIFNTTRVALAVEYDGSLYHGWQLQKGPVVRTVQKVLQEALAKVANHEVSVICAGRTDARVHATGQVVHFESDAKRSEKAWVCGVNANLPDDVVVKWAMPVTDEFHARFSATARTYRYVIACSSLRSAILHKKVTLIQEDLNLESMQEAANFLLGKNDFSAFRGAGCQANSAFRVLESVNIFAQGNLIITEIKANAFLLHMVRNIMGVLIEIGAGRRESIWAQQVLHSKDRQQAGKTAHPHGLYLVQAHYPEEFQLPVTEYGPAFIV
jgi:tRNA pseudouridine38-40 synthase